MITIINIITIITTTITTTIMLKSAAFFEGHFWRAQKVEELRIGDQKKSSCQAFGRKMKKKSYEGESALCRKP